MGELKNIEIFKYFGEFEDFLLDESEVENFETLEEIEEAINEQHEELCMLIQKEREIAIAKDKFLRVIYLLKVKRSKIADAMDLAEWAKEKEEGERD